MKKTAIIISLAVLASVSSAQNRNAFKQMDSILGVTVTRAQTTQGVSFTVAMGQNATVIRDGKSHNLEAIDGFWLLSNDGDLGAVQTAMTNYDNHSNNSGGSSAYGFQTQLKNGIRAGQSATFNFSQIGNAAALDHFGFKVKASGVPAHIYEKGDCQAVPEPATFAAIGIGIAALRRRRLKR
jgi:hypothetical protein